MSREAGCYCSQSGNMICLSSSSLQLPTAVQHLIGCDISHPLGHAPCSTVQLITAARCPVSPSFVQQMTETWVDSAEWESATIRLVPYHKWSPRSTGDLITIKCWSRQALVVVVTVSRCVICVGEFRLVVVVTVSRCVICMGEFRLVVVVTVSRCVICVGEFRLVVVVVVVTVSRCVICMGEFKIGDALRFLPCVHIYHKECIDDWLMRSFTCPSCMEPVDAAILTTYEWRSLPMPIDELQKSLNRSYRILHDCCFSLLFLLWD